MNRLGGRGRGKEVLNIKVEVPKNLTPKQKELLRAFAEELGEKNHKEKKSFIEKLKSYFKE